MFPGFLQATRNLLEDVEGTDHFVAAIETSLRLEAHQQRLRFEEIPEPDLLRLLLHRYGAICRSPSSTELERELAALIADSNRDPLSSDELVEHMQKLLFDAHLPGVRITVNKAYGYRGSMVTLDLPKQRVEGVGDADPSSETQRVLLLACLKCRAGNPVTGPRQIASAVAAFEVFTAAKIPRRYPIQLLICVDASRGGSTCGHRRQRGENREKAVIALDGIQPLVVSWLAEVSWHLELSHHPVTAAAIGLVRRKLENRRGRGDDRDSQILVVDAFASGVVDKLPEIAWMDLIDLRRTPTELAELVRSRIHAFRDSRPRSEYSIEIRGDRLRVTALAEPLLTWQISARRSALWDLAVMARELNVEDMPGSAVAAMLQVISRFDNDPNGRRLGLHYDDPIGDSLLVAPFSLSVQRDRVIFGVQMYRPPGLDRGDFLARLDEARDRLSYAAGRSLTEARREVGEPRGLAPDSEIVSLARRTFVQVTDSDALQPTGSPRPGLCALYPEALSLRLPMEGNRINRAPSISFLIELLWQLAIAPTDEERRASS